MRALPGPVADQVQAIRLTTAPAPDRGAARPDPVVTLRLVQACAQRRRVRLRHRSEVGSGWEADVEPWSVVVRPGRWYLLCRSLRADAVRAYRVDLVVEASEVAGGQGAYDIPTGLDRWPASRRTSASGGSSRSMSSSTPPSTPWRWVSLALGRVEPAGDDTSRLVGSTSSPYWYAEQLAAVPCPFHVVGGPELRHTVGVVGARLTAAVR